MARPGPGNGWRPTIVVGQAQLAAQGAHLVLEQLAQGLDQLHLHARRQAADIVVDLDGDRGAAGDADRFDHVGVERALGQEVGAADLLGLLLEHVDEGGADDLALLLGIDLAGQLAEEQVRGVAMDQMDVEAGRGTP